MAFSRRLSVIGMVGASWLLAIACEGDDIHDDTQPVAGEAGEAPIAGKSSAAGSKNNGGKAGASAGTGGTSGAAGGGGDAGNGGTTSDAGNGGTMSDAGNGGTMSGAGQAGSSETAGAGGSGGESLGGGGSGGATGGDGGSGGDGGTIPAIVVPHCSFACTSDDDCLIEDDDSQKCNPVKHVCEDPAESCTNDEQCLISKSGWGTSCANDAGCTANTQACVQANGQGYCATLPTANDPACLNSRVAKVLPKFGATGTVEVCASPDQRCFSGTCRPGCGAPNSGCGLGNGDTCNAATGLCECKTGGECEGTSLCGPDKHCLRCVTNDDCASTVLDLTCIQGHCGCGDPSQCVDFLGYSNATAQCQLL
jgi:hypothetical protein